MIKKAGWIFVLGAILLFIANVFTLGNQVVIIAKWASITSTIIGFVVCPIIFFIGIWILVMGKDK